MASATYAAKMMKDMGLIPEGYKIMVVGTVQEEDCDGMCWQYIYNKDGIKPEFVISTEPTDGGIYRGHRGRMEIRVDVHGTSCHGSAPDRGDNAIYKMADIIADVRALNNNGCDESTDIKGLVKMLDPKYNPEHFEDARFLGRGTCTVSQIFYTSPSRCAVADSCAISIDRRMTAGETWESCLDEIRNLPAAKKYGDDVKVSMYMYDRPSWTGEVYETEAYFPRGSTRRPLRTSRPSSTPTRPCSVTSASAASPAWTSAPVARCATSGPSPRTAFPSRAAMASPASASARVPSLRLTLPTRSPTRTTWSPLPPCMWLP